MVQRCASDVYYFCMLELFLAIIVLCKNASDDLPLRYNVLLVPCASISYFLEINHLALLAVMPPPSYTEAF